MYTWWMQLLFPFGWIHFALNVNSFQNALFPIYAWFLEFSFKLIAFLLVSSLINKLNVRPVFIFMFV